KNSLILKMMFFISVGAASILYNSGEKIVDIIAGSDYLIASSLVKSLSIGLPGYFIFPILLKKGK
mgnify:CR=1